MEHTPEEQKNPEVNLEKMRSIIARAPELIEDEMNRGTNNPWFACVNTQLQSLMSLTEFAHEDGELDTERTDQLIAKIREISAETGDYMKQYPTKDDEVPQELKDEMYRKLNILEL